MQIILMEKVANLGDLGSVVDVKSGYARNYLIPSGRARRATKDNLAEFEARRAELERSQADRLAAARARAEQLEGFMLQVARKAAMDGKLFGSVTNADIAEELTGQGMEVHRSEIRMPDGPLKVVGDHPVHLALHTDVHVEIIVSVLGAAV